MITLQGSKSNCFDGTYVLFVTVIGDGERGAMRRGGVLVSFDLDYSNS
jgi:hypothetical protein